MHEDIRRNSAETALLDVVGRELDKPISAPARAMGAVIAERFPGSAVLFYGAASDDSKGEAARGKALYDFYVIAPSYRSVFERKRLRMLNRLLPPNVFYVETPIDGVILRSKYAVVSLAHFERLCGMATFHSYFWGRFAQPSRIVCTPEAMRPRLERAVAAAVTTFCRRAAGLAPSKFTAADLWRAGLRASYLSELRAEKSDRADAVLIRYEGWPERVTIPALAAAGFKITDDNGSLSISPQPSRLAARAAWTFRRVYGGYLSVARLLKATTTFHGGIDYILWKIERHAGVTIEASDWQRRHPMLAAPGLTLRYYLERAKASRRSNA